MFKSKSINSHEAERSSTKWPMVSERKLALALRRRPDIDWPVSDEDGDCRYEKKNAGDAETQSKEQTRLYPLKKTTFYKKC